MEKLKQYNDIISLGKLLVDELQLGETVDTLGRWMAHHIADAMHAAEESEGREKSEAEDRCREAILSTWDHVNAFPQGRRPLSDIEPLLATIRALDPDNRAYFYLSEAQSQLDKSSLSKETREWLEMARVIDDSARLLIGMCLKKSASDISEDKRDYLKLAKSLDAENPLTNFLLLLADDKTRSDEDVKTEEIRKTIESLKNRRERLKQMVEMSNILMSAIEDEIHDMEIQLENKL